jgi:hypothetical protein
MHSEVFVPQERRQNKDSLMTSQNVIEDLFVFAIPLLPRSRAANWQRVLDNLQATLQSILNQRDQNFYCLLAVEDPIPLPEISNPRITLVNLQESQRKSFHRDSYIQANQDAGFKRAVLRWHAAKMGATYCMCVDADDLVSNKIVEYIRARKPKHGAALRTGYIMDGQTGKYLPAPSEHIPISSFDSYCGTSIITNLRADDQASSDPLSKIWNEGHHLIRDAAIENKTPLLDLHEPLGVYILNNGENLSTLESNASAIRSFAQSLIDNIDRYGSAMPKAQLEEFGLWSN